MCKSDRRGRGGAIRRREPECFRHEALAARMLSKSPTKKYEDREDVKAWALLQQVDIDAERTGDTKRIPSTTQEFDTKEWSQMTFAWRLHMCGWVRVS